MPASKNLPCVACVGCKHYTFRKGSGQPYYCDDGTMFSSSSKVGQNPDKDGPSNSCKKFKAK